MDNKSYCDGEISVLVCFKMAVDMRSWPQLCLDLILIIIPIIQLVVIVSNLRL